MMNLFENLYTEDRSIHTAYDVAKAAGDEAGMEKARNDHKTFSEGINAKGPAFIRIYRDYSTAREKGNACIDFSDVIWDNDVEPLVACMRENGIDRFTFSSGWSRAVETAWLFLQNGCYLGGMTEVYGDREFTMDDTVSYKKVPAYVFKLA